MAFKPNYNFQKAERDRAKTQKKQQKLQRLQEESARRKAERGEQADSEAGTAPTRMKSRLSSKQHDPCGHREQTWRKRGTPWIFPT